MDPESKPKPRPLKIEAHILAYLGDLLNHYEESIRRIARQDAAATTPTTRPQPLSTRYTAEQSPGGQ